MDNSTYNITLDEFLMEMLGPKHLDMSVVIPITVVYVVIFVTGVVGNISVCVVIATNTAMHTATNYYLFSLSVSDLTLLILGLPNDLSVYWEQYPWTFGDGICKCRALVSEMTSYTSVLTIVAFSMERYLAICHPLHSYAMSGLRRAVRIIAGLWIVSFFCALPFAIFTKVNYLDFPPNSGNFVNESAFCGMLEHNVPKNFPVYELSFISFFLIPMLMIMVLYMRIGAQIRDNSLSVDGTVHGETRRSQSRKTIIRMLSAVVITFFLCWAPFHVQRLLYLYGRNWEHFTEFNEWMYYITGCLYYFSSTINPILYNLMSMKYRNAFRQTLCGGKSRPRSFHSSFRETIVEGKWQRSMTWKKNNPSPTRDVVVMISPSPSGRKCYTTVTAASKNWPKTLLRVTMGSESNNEETISQADLDMCCDKNSSLNKVCIQMEACI
uniref:G-protein coupled receptors family 1 profile domain-containing protein n=1 Tax=Clastoptera arizonana TaxID=38151 RepID=A0A1B6C172_9HEMI